MAGIAQSFVIFLASTSLFGTAIAYSHFDLERTPLGGSLVVLDRIEHSKRQDGGIDLGTACEIDAACTTTSYGCECRFADESWASELDTEEKPPPDTADTPKPPPPPPPPPKNDPVDPPGKLHCEPTPAGKYKDAHKEKVKMIASSFCQTYANSKDQDAGDLPVAKTLFDRQTHFRLGVAPRVVEWNGGDHSEDDVYDIKVERVEDCKTDDGKLNLAKPVKDNECKDILESAWKECNNGGRGGSLVAGCLTYSIVTKF